MYSATTIDHFRNPRHLGRVADPHGIGRAASEPSPDGLEHCDDRLEFSVRIADGAVRAGFRAQACPACIAGASRLAERVQGASVGGARSVEVADLLVDLVDVPAGKVRCVALAPLALGRALDAAEGRTPPG